MEHDKYKDVSDEQLIVRLREGQPQVMDYLMEKYKNLVLKRANALYLIGGETQDLVQEGMIGLFKAVRDYRADKEVSFYHFAELCINRQMYTAVEASQRKKHTPLNTYIPLDAGQERLSQMERQVLALYLEGMNYNQIAEHMGKTPKAVDNALQRIRSKIRG